MGGWVGVLRAGAAAAAAAPRSKRALCGSAAHCATQGLRGGMKQAVVHALIKWVDTTYEGLLACSRGEGTPSCQPPAPPTSK